MKSPANYFLPISLILSTLVSAQDLNSTNNYHENNTETIVVTGTRTPKLLSNSPVSVTVISADEIELLTQGTIAQALNYIPGVVVTQNQKDGYNVQMQGFDGDNVLVLVNGQPLVAPTGAAVDLDQINALDIQQIEVIKGAASVMYGSSAMGGVINIITEQPTEDQLKLSYEIGSYLGNEIEGEELAHQAKINTTFLTNDWANQINLMVKSTPGFDYDDDHNSTQAGSLDKVFLNLGTSGKVNDFNSEIKYQYLREEKERADGIIPGQSIIDYYTSEVDQHQLDFHLGKDVFDQSKHDVADTSWHINTRLMHHDETSGLGSGLRDTNIELYELNGQYVWSPSKELEVVSGGVIHQDTLEQFNVTNNKYEVEHTTKESIEAFTQGNWILNSYQILLGARAQYDTDFGSNTAVRASGMYNFPVKGKKIQWRYGVGQGYRVPTLKERHYIFDHSNLGYKVYGNEDLEPEESVTFNSTISYQQKFTYVEFSTELNLHYTQADNLIETFHDPERSAAEELDISVYGNVDEATISGMDFSAELNFEQWFTQFNYSYLDAEDQDNIRLEARPYHQIKANLGYNNYTYDLDAIFYVVYQANEHFNETSTAYQNGSHNNEWTTLDFKLNQRINEEFSWRFGVENIFDVHTNSHAESEFKFDSRPTSSRYVYLGITYKL